MAKRATAAAAKSQAAKPEAGDHPRRRYSRRLPREQRAEQILDAALRLIAREGFAALTMDRVASEADIAKSVVYAIFSSPDRLQQALIEREQDRALALATATLGELRQAEDPMTGVARALVRFVDGVAEQPDAWRVVLLPVSGMPPTVRQAIVDGRERWRREIEPIATRILERAGLKRIDPELVAHLAHGNADYLARLMLEDPERFPRDRIVRFAAEAAGGIAALLSAGAAGR